MIINYVFDYIYREIAYCPFKSRNTLLEEIVKKFPEDGLVFLNLLWEVNTSSLLSFSYIFIYPV